MTLDRTPVQSSFNRRQPRGFPGQISRMKAPKVVEIGKLNIPSSTTYKLRPGDAVVWNSTNDAYQPVGSDAARLNIVGIVNWVGGSIGTPIEYSDDDIIEVVEMGYVYVDAGAALERPALVGWEQESSDTQFRRWVTQATPTDFTTTPIVPVEVMSPSSAAGDLIEVRIGYGRNK